MPVIIGEIKPFDISQKVYIKYDNTDGETYKVTINNVPNIISDLTYTEKINKVHLFGNNTYCDAIAEAIYSECNTKYSNNNIEIEVN